MLQLQVDLMVCEARLYIILIDLLLPSPLTSENI